MMPWRGRRTRAPGTLWNTCCRWRKPRGAPWKWRGRKDTPPSCKCWRRPIINPRTLSEGAWRTRRGLGGRRFPYRRQGGVGVETDAHPGELARSVSEHLAVDHRVGAMAGVFERIAVVEREVGVLAGHERARAVGDTEELGGVAGDA